MEKMAMRRPVWILLFLFTALPAQARGEGPGEGRARVQGYGFIGPSFRKGTNLEAGVGGKVGLWKSLGAGAEIAGLTGDLVAARVLSANLTYDFPSTRKQRRSVPFATFGYSRMAGDIILEGQGGAKNFLNFGVGITYWFRNRVGLVLEVRDYAWSSDPGKTHFAGFRLGFTFRRATAGQGAYEPEAVATRHRLEDLERAAQQPDGRVKR